MYLFLPSYDLIKNNSDSITLWGDGSPSRDFLYVEDAARGIVLATEKYDDILPVNLGSEEETTIKNLANIICEIMDLHFIY